MALTEYELNEARETGRGQAQWATDVHFPLDGYRAYRQAGATLRPFAESFILAKYCAEFEAYLAAARDGYNAALARRFERDDPAPALEPLIVAVFDDDASPPTPAEDPQ